MRQSHGMFKYFRSGKTKDVSTLKPRLQEASKQLSFPSSTPRTEVEFELDQREGGEMEGGFASTLSPSQNTYLSWK